MPHPAALATAALLALPLAHTSAATPPPAPAPNTAAAQPRGSEADARAILQRAIDKYRSLNSYSDTLHIRYDYLNEDGDPLPAPEMRATVRLARPRSFRIQTEQGAAICDGTTLWLHDANAGEYTSEPAPQRPDLNELRAAAPGLMLLEHPLAHLFFDPTNPTALLKDLDAIESITPETRGSEPGHRITGRGSPGDMGFGEDTTCPITLWISERTGLLGEITYDLTEVTRRMYEEMASEDQDFPFPKIKRATVAITLEDAQANPDLPADAFTFKPGPEDQQVAELTPPWAIDSFDQQLLVGHPAPDFEGTLLDGSSFKLSDLRGKVVLLDFWATWCGPCVQAIPHIQKIAETFADKPVAVVGMNRDNQGSEDHIRRFLEKKKITFPQFLDFEGAAAEAYGVTGIPCTVLIDARGIVQHVSVGFMPGHEKDLTEHIETLLAGKDLFDPARVSAEPPRPGSDARDADDARIASPDNLNPETLVPGERLAGVQYLNQYNMRRFDLDGDGRDEVICPDMNGSGIVVLSADGASVTKIKLRGGKRSESIQSAEPIRHAGEVHWLITRTAWTGDQSRSSISLHAPDGAALWTFAPEIPEKGSCNLQAAAADLTGDGVPEIVLGITTFKMRKTGSNTYMHEQQSASLAILDWSGNLLAQRRVGQSINFLMICDPASPNDPRHILVGADRVRRFAYNPSRASTEPTP